VATPAFAQFQQLRQFGAGVGPNPNPHSNWSDNYGRNDGLYAQPAQRANPNDYPSDNYNVLGNNTPGRGISLSTPSFSFSR